MRLEFTAHAGEVEGKWGGGGDEIEGEWEGGGGEGGGRGGGRPGGAEGTPIDRIAN